LFVYLFSLSIIFFFHSDNMPMVCRPKSSWVQLWVSLFLESRHLRPMCACDATRLLGFLILKRIF